MTDGLARSCPRCGIVTPTAGQLCAACLLASAFDAVHDPFPYQLLSPIAEDARGTTYLAQPAGRLRQFLAVKIFRDRDDVDDVLMRYERWAPALARVRHPAVSAIAHLGVHEGRLFAASDYVPGWPLTQLANHPEIGTDERRAIAAQLTGAFDAIRAEGLAHLKIDASRIVVSSGARATMLGLGAAIVIDGWEVSAEADARALEHVISGLL